MEEIKERRLGFLRFGLTAAVAMVFAVSAAMYYLTLAPLGALDMVVQWTGIFTGASAALSLGVYFGYKAFLMR